MEIYNIFFSNKSVEDLNIITKIIFNFTKSEKITNNIYEKIVSEIYSLKILPYRTVEYKNYRVLIINKKYKVFYKINEIKKEIEIHRILFSSSNYQKNI